jgi:hypothetical protein
MAGPDADPATGAAGRWADGTSWCDDQGGGPIPPDHVGMRAVLGPVPEVATDAPGYGDGGPQAFMVEMGAATAPLRTHFHVVDQFQVVVHGGGTLGRHRLGPGAVHYADALHPYGPLAAGPDGLAYLTLRATSDTGAWFTPDRRDDLAARRAADPRAARRRNLSCDVGAATAPSGVSDLVEASDGLRIASVALGEREAVTVPAAGSGAYAVVLAGALEPVHGLRRDPGVLAWSPPGGTLDLVAGGSGATAVVVQLPLAHTSVR